MLHGSVQKKNHARRKETSTKMLEIRARELFGGIYSFSVLPGMDGGGDGQRRKRRNPVTKSLQQLSLHARYDPNHMRRA